MSIQPLYSKSQMFYPSKKLYQMEMALIVYQHFSNHFKTLCQKEDISICQYQIMSLPVGTVILSTRSQWIWTVCLSRRWYKGGLETASVCLPEVVGSAKMFFFRIANLFPISFHSIPKWKIKSKTRLCASISLATEHMGHIHYSLYLLN